MLNRKFMSIFIWVSLTLALATNYFLPLVSLWILLLIPAIGTVVLFPTWKTTIVGGLFGIILMVITEFMFRQGPIQSRDAVHLLMTGVVEWAVFVVISFFSIKIASLIHHLEELALTDPLTKIHNRRYLELYMEKAIPFCQRKGYPMTMIIFDVDHFKFINDTYGHNAGDMVLIKITRAIERIIRNSDVFVRIGGEEFIIILPNCPLEQGIKFAERIRKAIEGIDVVYKDTQICVTISIGVTEYVRGQDLNQFIDRADYALYCAKKSGRNTVVAI